MLKDKINFWDKKGMTEIRYINQKETNIMETERSPNK